MTSSQRLVDGVLQQIDVTDRVYHDLAHTEPLVVHLVDAIRSVPRGAKVLAVFPNALLPHVLLELGYEVAIWQHPETILTDDLLRLVRRVCPLDELQTYEAAAPIYDVIVLPYVLEASDAHPAHLLAYLHRWLAPSGVIVTAYRRAGSIHYRVAGARGRSVPLDPLTHRSGVAYSWPPLPAKRIIGRDELGAWARLSAFRMTADRPVVDKRAAVAIHALSFFSWVKAEASHLLKRLVPSIRDCAVASLAAFERGERVRAVAGLPRVSVVVTVRWPKQLESLLAPLRAQTYPNDRFEVILLVPAGASDPDAAEDSGTLRIRIASALPEGPVAANEALSLATGEVIAFVDDDCAIPPAWIETGASGLLDRADVVFGEVVAAVGSALPFLVLPGSRPTRKDDSWGGLVNTFASAAALRAAGGFDERFIRDGVALVGWQSEIGSRLLDQGYVVRREAQLQMSRLFRFPAGGRRAWMKEEFQRARTIPVALQRMRGSERLLARGIFVSDRTLLFDVLLLGLLTAALTGASLFVLLAIPWVASVRSHLPFWPPVHLKTMARNLRGMLVRHVLWLAGFLVGSIQARRLVL